ncbi:MAG TPA: hypothetical protein VLM40_19880 [Gemmata sp.]|nr:hypothetical protein [Gemmata sp.]
MANFYVVAGLVSAVALGLGLAHFVVRRRGPRVAFANDREERLTRQFAEMVGCSLADAHPWIRKEIQIAPDQVDDKILKRAEYHYRRSQPDEPWRVWGERQRR